MRGHQTFIFLSLKYHIKSYGGCFQSIVNDAQGKVLAVGPQFRLGPILHWIRLGRLKMKTKIR